ncbi:Hamartin protein-domain-containing protein [Pseudomassariella vexata]|uniref:Hamartin protein-domain-containing protein n=1 Tax=Pseudomassariella vexata TaxID=1141098 RepID=A0A1Y2DV86_9PEZI|nr:Hamartin protein-domain-containing protein [Pseudomassariella vexata]ORY63183.1 Hamartin protein-domain-containing protein [Pseudomassariella vexata]
MASAPSLKELTKAISTAIPTASLPLPDDLVEILEGYLRKHEKFDESISDKLNDELLTIYQKEVAHFPARYVAFLNIIRRLRPLVGQPEKILRWWDLCLPVFAHLNKEKDLASESQAVVLDILTSDDTNEAEGPNSGSGKALAETVLTMWVRDCKVAGRGEDALENFKEKQLRETLIIYGKKRPKDFMTMLDKCMVKQEWRVRALYLMADFIQHQPPHLHQVLHTPLFGTLIKCLQLDTSTTIVSLALTVLTMVLPHMPSSLVPQLPTLFNIYARLLFWERELSATEFGLETETERRLPSNSGSWEKRVYSPEFDDTAIPHLLNYFTILYGLYPINFMDYIRKPQRYLRHAEVPNADDIEIQPTEIRHASERFRQCHLLHENFYTLTIESERTDFGRWIKSEPAEVVADCMALCQPTEPAPMPGAPILSVKDNTDRDGYESALLSSSFPAGLSLVGANPGENWRNTQSTPFDSTPSSRVQSALIRQSSQSSRQSHRDSSSTRPSRNGGDSPTLPAQLTSSGSYTHLQDMINSNKVIKSGLHQSLANDSVPSLALSHHDSTSERPPSHMQPIMPPASTPLSTTEHSEEPNIRHLYRQILLLHNDLTFERFMKQQHLTHMGALRRRQVREAASEAETQNLIMANRHLKQRLEEAKKNETQVKKDSEKSRTLAKKWEADLSAKLRAIRDEQKKWLSEGDSLRRDLDAAKTEAENLRQLVCDAEVKELGWKQSMQAVEANASELERLRKEVKRLTVIERTLQAKETEREASMTRAAEADSRSEMLKMKLEARDAELRQTHNLYQSQIVVLNAKLHDALKNGEEQRNFDAINHQFESTLAASRAQQGELRKRIAELTRKNKVLSNTVSELQLSILSRSNSDSHPPASPSGELSLHSSDTGSLLSFRNRSYIGLAESEGSEVMSHNSTLPLGQYNAVTPVSSHPQQRPSTPDAETSGSASKGSPNTDRYHGRGEQPIP